MLAFKTLTSEIVIKSTKNLSFVFSWKRRLWRNGFSWWKPIQSKPQGRLDFQHIFDSKILLKYIQGGTTQSPCRQDLNAHSGRDEHYVNLISLKYQSLFHCSTVKAVIRVTLYCRKCMHMYKSLEWIEMETNGQLSEATLKRHKWDKKTLQRMYSMSLVSIQILKNTYK